MKAGQLPESTWPLLAATMLKQLELKWGCTPTNIELPAPRRSDG